MMECKVEKAMLSLYENGVCTTECPVDGEYLLPDYCPDMAAVLKCTMVPAVLARRIGGDKLVVEGEATVRVLYLDEERKCVYTFECIQPFSCTLPWEENDGSLPYVTTKVNYLNCRATSPRRISIHGTLATCCTQEKKRSAELLSEVAGDAVYCKYNTVKYSVPIGCAEKNFSVVETVDIGVNKPPAERIVRTSCVAMVDTVKTLTDKAIVKGKIVLRTLYITNAEKGLTACTSHEFPFSQILDAEGISEEHTPTVHTDVLSKDIHVQTDVNGNGTLLSVNIKLCVRLDVVCQQETVFVADAYAGKYPCRTTRTQMTAEQLLFSCSDTTTLKEILELPSDTVAEIVDLWCEAVSLNTRTDAQHSYVDGRLQISMLTRDSDGCIAYYEHVSEFSLQFADICDRMVAEICVAETDFSVVGKKIEIRIELCSTRCGYGQTLCNAVSNFETEKEPYADEKAALRICRAKKGDSVWEIAKSCHTAMEAIMEENALTDDCLSEDMLLLVPLC